MVTCFLVRGRRWLARTDNARWPRPSPLASLDDADFRSHVEKHLSREPAKRDPNSVPLHRKHDEAQTVDSLEIFCEYSLDRPISNNPMPARYNYDNVSFDQRQRMNSYVFKLEWRVKMDMAAVIRAVATVPWLSTRYIVNQLLSTYNPLHTPLLT